MKLDLKAWVNKITDFCTCDLLFNGSLNNGETKQLSASIANYKRIIIVAHDSDGARKTFEVINENASSFFTYCDFTRLYSGWYSKSAMVTFNGTSMTMTKCGQAYFSSQAQGNYVTIDKVYGCKNIVGGVVRKLLKALKPLTLGRGWAV